MKKLAFIGGAAGLGFIALLSSPLTDAADHLDNVGLAANPMADLNDVYAWNTTDATSVNLAMTVSPRDDGTRTFGPNVLYAFHVTSRPGFGMAGVESKVICKFANNTNGECWVVDPANKVIDYVKGDFSGATGRVSASDKLRVFAGQRSDPFFFNFGGFVRAVGAAETTCGGACPGTVPVDAAGCLQTDAATAGGLRTLIGTAPPADIAICKMGEIDCFATKNVMAIVIQVDKSELLSGMDKVVSVWASTHASM